VRVKQNSKITERKFYERAKELRQAEKNPGYILLSATTETLSTEKLKTATA